MASKEQAARNLEAAVARGLKRRGLKPTYTPKATPAPKPKRRPKYDPLARENLEKTLECYKEIGRRLEDLRRYCEAPGLPAKYYEAWGQERIDIINYLKKANALSQTRLLHIAWTLRTM